MNLQRTGQTTMGNAAISPALVREKVLLGSLPFGRTTLWKLVKEGSFPKPTKLSSRVAVWKKSDVEAWMAKVGE